jgi:hypothetical protein
MSSLQVKTVVACPLAQASLRLHRYFSAHGNQAGDTARLNLHATIAPSVLPAPVKLERPVIATIQTHHEPADLTPNFRVQWAPESPGPLPLFSGEIRISGADDYNSFVLELHGGYDPPGGIAGEAFDTLFGNRVAEQTASELLAEIKAFIEEDFAKDEHAKHASN